MKRVCEPGCDRITNLPADVIQQILELLPIKDAAKLATLSIMWMRHWRSIPQLVFDDSFTIGKAVSKSNKMMAKLVWDVHKVLLVHDGPITKFELWFPGLKSCDGIDQIIFYLSSRGLQEFTLKISPCCEYKLHSSLFSSLHLNSLHLGFCEFRQPSWFEGFSKLTVLHLMETTLPSDFFDNFLPKCPMLEHLRLVLCPCPSNHEIIAPRLNRFVFWGDLQKVYFKCTPLLKVFAIIDGQCAVDKPADVVALFASLPALQHCSVDFQLLEYFAAGDINLPIRLPTLLHQLKFLHAYRLEFGSLKKARAFVCLVMSSPNLHELTIELATEQVNQPANNDAVPSIESLLEAENRRGLGCCLQHLSVFNIFQYELDILSFILATVPILRKVGITPADNLDSSKASKFVKKVMKYERVSKQVEVILLPKKKKK